MGRIRTIKPDFFTDADVLALSALDRLFFIGIWTQADKAGRLHNRPWELKLRLMPDQEYDAEAGVQALVERGFLVSYSDSKGTEYLAVRTWEDHQRPHHTEAESRLPGPDNGEVTVKHTLSNRCLTPGREGKGKERKEYTLVSDKTLLGGKEDDEKPPSKAQYSEAFEEWYAAYPRKTQKAYAYKCYQRALGRVAGSHLLERTKVFAGSPIAQTRFCPHPSTWLNQGRWEDDEKEWQNERPEATNQRGRVRDSDMPDLDIIEA